MAHTFTVSISDDITEVLGRVESEIAGSGGTFSGDREKGVFQGNSIMGQIRGDYLALSGNEIRISITDKPFFVSYSMIEGEIKKYFS